MPVLAPEKLHFILSVELGNMC